MALIRPTEGVQWARVATMDIYAHVLPEMHVEVADKLDAALFGPRTRQRKTFKGS